MGLDKVTEKLVIILVFVVILWTRIAIFNIKNVEELANQ